MRSNRSRRACGDSRRSASRSAFAAASCVACTITIRSIAEMQHPPRAAGGAVTMNVLARLTTALADRYRVERELGAGALRFPH